MLLTSARIQSASRICRFNGWTTRPYSILEHSIIGTRVLAEIGKESKGKCLWSALGEAAEA